MLSRPCWSVLRCWRYRSRTRSRLGASPTVCGFAAGGAAGSTTKTPSSFVKKQRCVTPVRSAGKSPALPGPVRERTALFPQSAFREADAGGDQHGLLDLTQRHGWVLRFELIRSVDHGEAQAEATRSSPIEGLEERITPDFVEWV